VTKALEKAPKMLRAKAVYVSGHEYLRELDWHCRRCGRKRVRGELRPPRCLGLLGRLVSFLWEES